MNLTIPFFMAVSGAIFTNFIDWKTTIQLIAKHGLAGEKNPIMRFFMSKSKWLALAYKMWPYPLLIWAADFHFRDIMNYGVAYSNGPGTDYWAIAWILAAVVGIGMGLWGWLNNRKEL